MKLLYKVIALLSLLLLLPKTTISSSPQQQSPEPITIAAVFSKSGLAASHNLPLMQMTELAVQEINNRGGLLGRPLKLQVFDNLSTPIGSALAAYKIVQQKIPAVIGAHWSSHSLAMADILQEAGIPMITPGSTNPGVTKGKDYIFRACFIDSFQGLAMAKFAYTDIGARTAVVVSNIDEDYSTTLARFFSSAFKKRGGNLLKEIGYRGNATDFRTHIKSILKLVPDVVYLPGYTRDSGLFIKQARKLGFKGIFLGGDAWDEIIEESGGESVNGSFQSAPWHPEVPFEQSKILRRLYTATYGHEITNMSSPLAFDAVMILAGAISRAGSTDPNAIRKSLRETEYLGATGKIFFDENGDPTNKAAIIIEFKNNSRIFKKTVTP